jgi:hypothetical protein
MHILLILFGTDAEAPWFEARWRAGAIAMSTASGVRRTAFPRRWDTAIGEVTPEELTGRDPMMSIPGAGPPSRTKAQGSRQGPSATWSWAVGGSFPAGARALPIEAADVGSDHIRSNMYRRRDLEGGETCDGSK